MMKSKKIGIKGGFCHDNKLVLVLKLDTVFMQDVSTKGN